MGTRTPRPRWQVDTRTLAVAIRKIRDAIELLVLNKLYAKELYRKGMTMKALCKLALGVVLLLSLITMAWAEQPTQFSTDGNVEAKLLKAKVREGVLTVNVALKNISEKWIEPEFCFGASYYIDIKDKVKYSPLKDSKGRWIAGPVTYSWGGGTFHEKIRPGSQKLFWIKFPAPKSGAQKVDLFIPILLPFEGVELQ